MSSGTNVSRRDCASHQYASSPPGDAHPVPSGTTAQWDLTTCLLLWRRVAPEFITRTFGPATAEQGWAPIAPDVRGMTMPADGGTYRRPGLDRYDVVLANCRSGARRRSLLRHHPGRAHSTPSCRRGWAIRNQCGLTRTTASTDRCFVRQRGPRGHQRSVHRPRLDPTTGRTAWTAMTDAQVGAPAGSRRTARARLRGTGDDHGERTRCGLADDPTHPEHVASAWAAAIMDATLAVLSPPRTVIGRSGGPLVRRPSGSR